MRKPSRARSIMKKQKSRENKVREKSTRLGTKEEETGRVNGRQSANAEVKEKNRKTGWKNV